MRTHPLRTSTTLAAVVALAAMAVLAAVLVLTAPVAHAIVPSPTYQVTGLVSVDSSGKQGTSAVRPQITPDGRYVVFEMTASTLPGAGPLVQVFRHDQLTGQTLLVSAARNAAEVPNGSSLQPSVSDDGRFVAFESAASNLVQTDGNFHKDVFLRDVDTSTTRVISAPYTGGGTANADSGNASIDGAGDKVAFESAANNIVSSDGNGASDVFVRSWLASTTTKISVGNGSAQADGDSVQAQISGNGSWVTFVSAATNLILGDLNNHSDVFLRQVSGGITTLVSSTGPALADGPSSQPSLDDDGSHVVFNSYATNLVASDTNTSSDTFRWTRSTHAIQRMSVNAFGLQVAKGSSLGTAISRDGQVVAWTSVDKDVTTQPGNGLLANVYVRDINHNATNLVSANAGGKTGNGTTFRLSVDQAGRFVAYDSSSPHLVRHDTNGDYDAFVTDRRLPVAPFIDVEAFVTQQFKDFVGRPPTAGELQEGVAVILNGELTPPRYIVAKARAAAWAGKRAPVLRLYWAFFLRAPDQGGFDHWFHAVTVGSSLDNIAQQFAQSPEFTGKYGALSDSGFVKLVYANVLVRQPDSTGLAYWVDRLQHHGLKRGSMMVGFSESLEGQHVIGPATDVVLIHLGMLRAVPAKAFFDQWRGDPPASLVTFVLASGPYHARFP